MITTVYLAGPYHTREVLQQRAAELEKASGGEIEVTSRWLDGEHEAQDGNPTTEQMRRWACDDLEDIDIADVFVQFTDHPTTRGGAHTEFGYAMKGHGKYTIVCGPVTNIFHALADRHVETWDEVRTDLLDFARTASEGSE